jgi:hypothetical protein
MKIRLLCILTIAGLCAVALGRQYGELDGEIAYEYAVAFVSIYKTMDAQQKEKLAALRSSPAYEDSAAFLYSDRILPTKVPDSSFLFGTTKAK